MEWNVRPALQIKSLYQSHPRTTTVQPLLRNSAPIVTRGLLSPKLPKATIITFILLLIVFYMHDKIISDS